MTIATPGSPTGYQYEDFVVAWLQAAGYFTETRLVLKEDTTELLELDAVASPSGSLGNAILVDAKRGLPKHRDAFTAFGWRMFLGFDHAALVHSEPIDDTAASGFAKINQETSVSCVHVDPGQCPLVEPFQNHTGASEELRVEASNTGWFKQLAVRIASAELLKRARADRGNEALQQAKDYHLEVQSSFFERTPIARVHRLYGAYSASPKLSGALVQDLAQAKGVTPQTIWKSVRDSKEHRWLQYAMLLEHQGRIAVIKNGLDHTLAHSQESEITETSTGLAGILASLAPANFRAALGHLESLPEPSRVPAFLQQFVELLGGWYRPESEDLELVAELTGIAATEIEDYLGLLDHFFPFPGGWFSEGIPGLRILKLVPAFIRGAGCFLRRSHFEIEDYEVWAPGAGRSLVSWHNALYGVLQPHIGRRNE